MKRIPIFILLLLLVAALAIAAGCGDDSGGNEIEGEGRKITGEQGAEGEGNKVTVEGEQGQATIEVEAGEYTEETLGVPIYPGAAYVPGSGVNATTTSGDKVNTFMGAEFTTADALKKVSDWYTAALGEADEATPEETVWLFQDSEGMLYLVKVETEEGQVKITINKTGGNIDIDL